LASRFGRALAQFRDMRCSALGALLPAIDRGRQNLLETSRLQKAPLDVIGNEGVQLLHRHCTARAAGLALAGLGRAGAIPVAPFLPGPQVIGSRRGSRCRLKHGAETLEQMRRDAPVA
jgi:hypothetical protein